MATPINPFKDSFLLSPSQTDSQSNTLNNLRIAMKFNEIVCMSYTKYQQELHANRMKGLREEVDYIEATAWMYTPIEKLLGQK